MLQFIQYQGTRQLVDHNYNLRVFSGPAWTNQRKNMDAGGFVLFSTSNPQRLPNPMSDKSASRHVLSRRIPVLENELLQDVKTSNIYLHFEISCGV